MRYAMIMAGGSGTRLWPMSRAGQPKQLLPLFDGRSLLQLAYGRLAGLVAPEQRYVCAAEQHRQVIIEALDGLGDERFLGEPTGRDTLNAVGLSAAVLAARDSEAVMAVFTADHLIAPDDAFRALVEQAFDVVEAQPHLLLTFGVTPTAAATGYGYLELAEPLAGGAALRVRQFREKPDAATAETFLAAGPTCYLWNSGMFVWRCATLLDCIRRFEPETHAGLSAIAAAWDTPRRTEVLADIYPTLRKISIDFAVMEPASRDEQVGVAAVPMALDWLDVGSWPTLARALGADDQGNTVVAERAILLDSRDTLVASSDPTHLVTTIGLEGIIVIHTPEATLVCSAAHAEAIKELHRRVGEQFGLELL